MSIFKKIISISWLVITFAVLLILFFYIQKMMATSPRLISDTLISSGLNQGREVNNSVQANSKSGSIRAKGYFINQNSQCLEPIDVDIEGSDSYIENCYNIITAMQKREDESLVSPIPKDISIRGIYLLDDGKLIIDLPALILKEISMANTAIGELLWIYSLTNTLLQKELYNESKVFGLRILIEGAEPEIKTFEHININSVFSPDYLSNCSSGL